MKTRSNILVFILGSVFLMALNAPWEKPLRAAERIEAPHVSVFWIAPDIFDSKLTQIAIGYSLEPTWHVYWKNPGDSGTRPKIELTSSDAKFGSLKWPAPKRIIVGDLVSFGYEGPTAGIAFEITPLANKASISAQADLEWLVCREEECIPGRGTLTLDRPISENQVWDETNRAMLNNILASVPLTDNLPDSAPKFTAWKAIDDQKFELTATFGETLEALELFPTNGDWLKPQYEKTVDGKTITLQFKSLPGTKPPTKAGLVATWTNAAGLKQQAEWTDIPVLQSASTIAPSQSLSLMTLLLFALLGGIFLNLMPCVFPVLSIKVLSLLKQHPHKRERLRQAFLYSAGVILSFAILGGIVLVLQAIGSSVGWGFQLQSPLVVFLLAIFFFLMALSFLGVFEFGNQIMNLAGQSKNAGSFFSGFLAVFVAAPCTGPFMGSALGAALTVSAFESMSIFIMLGVGLALPYVLLALNPRTLAFLPKSGNWMIRLKEFMAFPLFLTVLWLLWVLSGQVGTNAWLFSLIAILTISFALWLSTAIKNPVISKMLAGIIVGAAIIFGGLTLDQMRPSNLSVGEGWTQFTKTTDDEIAQKRKQGISVFVDYTAAWCITCQWNKKAVLDTDKAQELFRKTNTWLVQADWTLEDPAITKSLASFGRNSVPLYVFYPPKGEPKILPQLLTHSILEQMYVD